MKAAHNWKEGSVVNWHDWDSNVKNIIWSYNYWNCMSCCWSQHCELSSCIVFLGLIFHQSAVPVTGTLT